MKGGRGLQPFFYAGAQLYEHRGGFAGIAVAGQADDCSLAWDQVGQIDEVIPMGEKCLVGNGA